jgi:hypothetical protein
VGEHIIVQHPQCCSCTTLLTRSKQGSLNSWFKNFLVESLRAPEHFEKLSCSYCREDDSYLRMSRLSQEHEAEVIYYEPTSSIKK